MPLWASRCVTLSFSWRLAGAPVFFVKLTSGCVLQEGVGISARRFRILQELGGTNDATADLLKTVDGFIFPRCHVVINPSTLPALTERCSHWADSQGTLPQLEVHSAQTTAAEMRTSASLLTALAGSTLVLANPAPAAPRPLVTPRPLPGGHIVARQAASTGGSDQELTCIRAFNSIQASMPTPAPELAEWLNSQEPLFVITDPAEIQSTFTSVCESLNTVVTPPASLVSAQSSFVAAGSSWRDEKSAELMSLQSQCPGDISAQLGLHLMTDDASCTSAILGLVEAAGNPVPTAGAGDNAGSDDDANTPTTTESSAGVAAARETGLVAAVAAVAVGVAGAIAAL